LSRLLVVVIFRLRASISVPIDAVFDVLTDHRGQAARTALRSSTVEREGEPDPGREFTAAGQAEYLKR